MKFFRFIYNFCASWTGTIIIVLFIVFFVAQAFIIPSRSMVSTLYEGDMLFVKKFSYGIPIPKIPWLEVAVLPDFRGNGHLIEGSRPQRGDVVIFIPPSEPKTYYVKRDFAVGGDEVIFTQKGLYLHPHEGDEYVDSHYKDSEVAIMMGKKFVFEPYSKEHPGIHYKYNNSSYGQMVLIAQEILNSPFPEALGTNNNPNAKGIAMMPMNIDGEWVFYKKIAPDEFFMVGDNRDNSNDSRFWGSVPYKNIVGKPWFIYFSINLKNSEEVDAQNNPKEVFSIRWKRVFRTVESLEKSIKEHNQEQVIEK
ncbi:signal peptidase I [Helicobacter cappadocius]|uniref:Signal peptidase I n=1 Tax=Helicobacter cappadocius TaxID=3063998 RepID=A0AA90PUA3_9HELI|nr:MULTISPECIES: signal peptidase I [unclassified Helicobacter]MDO7253741.1 signal peptidase I [Helicobacter sp. faydin-H75]MDP2539669.1 signal peptidase I [Helicobacter sp. faydin-H76]